MDGNLGGGGGERTAKASDLPKADAADAVGSPQPDEILRISHRSIDRSLLPLYALNPIWGYELGIWRTGKDSPTTAPTYHRPLTI